MLALALTLAHAGADTGFTVQGSTLSSDTASGPVTVDVLPFVHVQSRGVSDVAVQLLESEAVLSGDVVVTSWIVRGETADQPWLSFWIGVAEPKRGNIAGFPLATMPQDLSISADGSEISWTDDTQLHTLRVLEAGPSKNGATRPPPLPLEHLQSSPLVDEPAVATAG